MPVTKNNTMKTLTLLVAGFLSLIAVDAFACQKYTNTVQDASGNVLSGTTIIVKLAGQSTNATIYSDSLCSVVQTNPYTNASDGYFTFYAKNARYDISFSKTSYTFTSGNTSDLYIGEPLVGAGRLTYVGATSIQFCPYNGNYVHIPNGTTKSYNIPSACVIGANTSTVIDGTAGQNLAASTTYYVYLFDSAGTLTIEFSTTTHVTDVATGIEVKTSNATRALVGLIRTNGSSQFADSASNRFTISYFNRRDIGGRNAFTADRTTASVTFVEVNSEIRAEFVTWSDEAVTAAVSGACVMTATNLSFVTIGFDSATAEDTHSACNAQTARQGVHANIYKTGLTEGYHYATLVARVAASTMTLTGSATPGERTTLQVAIRG
ncbi:MAG: hypothetical protein D4R44_08140 [Actinobacteria bacterium]|nr:MAG: hypothetical protein D4R44_08140 [Actinomycetota bacterium]